jgi:mannose-6-phosphate isomerase-like protein (cupin superfamily)
MDDIYNLIHSKPENEVFKVVFFPDRIYHEQYLNATVSSRYRYNVREVRSKHDFTVLKGEVYLDGHYYTNFIRVEYRASRLVETARQHKRFIRNIVHCWIHLLPEAAEAEASAEFKLHYCEWIAAYQAEIWQTLEAPNHNFHDIKVKAMMGKHAEITRVKSFTQALSNLGELQSLEISFREHNIDLPFGYRINEPTWDNNYLRTHESPVVDTPSAPENTIRNRNYFISFQRGWYLQAKHIDPVRYRNAMMEDHNPETEPDNILGMRWLLQRELGGNLIYFHQVEIEPGIVEGTHHHIGSEELYYIVSGTGTAYMGEHDDPNTEAFPTVEREVYMIGKKRCKEVPVESGSIIYTKSGGIHGIKNNGTETLVFVAFGYHSN